MGSYWRAPIWIGAGVLAAAAAVVGVGGALLCENALRSPRHAPAVRPGWETVTIQGLRDANVSPVHARAIAASGPSVTLRLVPGAGHTGAATADPEGFKRRVLGWFQGSYRP